MSSSLVYPSLTPSRTVPPSKKPTSYVAHVVRTYERLPYFRDVQVALKNNVDYVQCLGMVREARSKGLTAPVLLMGVYPLHNGCPQIS